MATRTELETADRSVRDTARQEMPRTLREEVRLAGDALGQVIAEHGGAELLADVETLRRTVITARGEDRARGGHAGAADTLVSSWTLERAEQVARAFTCYFHLVNLAEERYRARALREADFGASGPAEALAAALAAVREELGQAGLDEQLAALRVHPVFTAHPTEARRRAVTSALRRVGDQLEVLADPRVVGTALPETRRRLLEEVDGLWRTAQLRSQELQPLDEVRTLMGVFDTTLFRLVPAVYRELDSALDAGDGGTRPPTAPAFLRFGSWVGGDRDGNPQITAHTTRETLLIQSEHILRGPGGRSHAYRHRTDRRRRHHAAGRPLSRPAASDASARGRPRRRHRSPRAGRTIPAVPAARRRAHQRDTPRGSVPRVRGPGRTPRGPACFAGCARRSGCAPPGVRRGA